MTFTPQWFAVYVRSRHEKRVADHLAARGVERFLPLYKSDRNWQDRIVSLAMPLFPGYLFVRIAIENRMQVLESPGVLYLVGASGRPEPLEDTEIESMKTIYINERMLKPLPHAIDGLKAGDRVRVVRGPLRGYCGYLSRTKKGRVVLVQELVQRAVSVEVDMDAIELETCAGNAQAPPAGACGTQVSANGLAKASGRTESQQMISEKPHALALTHARKGIQNVEAGELPSGAPASQLRAAGDPILGDGGPGSSPQRPPA